MAICPYVGVVAQNMAGGGGQTGTSVLDVTILAQSQVNNEEHLKAEASDVAGHVSYNRQDLYNRKNGTAPFLMRCK